MIRQLVSDFPYALDHLSMSNWSFEWDMRNDLPRDQLGTLIPPTTNKFQREIHIPIDVVMELRSGLPLQPIVPLLNALVDTARETIRFLRDGAV